MRVLSVLEELERLGRRTARGNEEGGEIGVAGAVTLGLARGEGGNNRANLGGRNPSELPGASWLRAGCEQRWKRRLYWTAPAERVSDGSVMSEKRA